MALVKELKQMPPSKSIVGRVHFVRMFFMDGISLDQFIFWSSGANVKIILCLELTCYSSTDGTSHQHIVGPLLPVAKTLVRQLRYQLT